MGAQKKGAVAAKEKGQFKPTPKKMFQEQNEDDFDSSDPGSDFEMEEVPQKTPNKQGMTPKQNQSGKKKDMRVSFQLLGKGTPQQQKMTPKGKAGTPQQQKVTPAVNKKGMNPFGAKVEKMTPPIKGKVFHPKGNKGNAEQNDSDDDDEEDDSDNEDDFNDEDMENDMDELENSDEEGDDDDDEDDDDEDDDDDDDDDEDDEEIKKAIMAMQNKKSNGVSKKTPQKEKSPTKQQEAVQAPEPTQTPKSVNKQNKTVENTPKSTNKPVQTPKAVKEANKTQSPKPESQMKGSPTKPQMSREQWLQERREQDKKKLFVRGIPSEVTADELKKICSDIVDVIIPRRNKGKPSISYYAFLLFGSEEKAEENYTFLQKTQLRGQSIFVDFSGEKSKSSVIPRREELASQDSTNAFQNKKKLLVSGYPLETTIDAIATLFPRAMFISMQTVLNCVSSKVLFDTEEAAAEALSANSEAAIGGKSLTVVYAEEKPNMKRQWTKQSHPSWKRARYM